MRVKIVRIFLSLVGVIFLSGCASEPQTGHPSNKAWYQAGISAEQTKRDLAECQYESLVNGQSYSPIPAATAGQAIALGMLASSAENSRENQIVQTCMAAKGYSLVNTNSPLLTIVPIANMTAEQQKSAIEKAYKTKAESGDAEAQYQLGSCYYNGGFGFTKDFTEAIKWYQKAADQNYPNMQLLLASAYAQRGVLELKNGDLDGALADYNKAIEIKPDFIEVYCVRGYVKQCKGDLDGAMADCEKVIEMNPKLALVYSIRGLINYNLHKFTDAMADFRKSCEWSSDVRIQDGSYSYIWLIRARLGEQDAATKELQIYLNNRKTGTSDDCSSKVCPFLTGQLSEPDFFKAAENTDNQTNQEQVSETVPEQHCEVYFYAGSKRLIEGDKTTATDYFEKCLATGCKEVGEYNSAAVELKSLETSK